MTGYGATCEGGRAEAPVAAVLAAPGRGWRVRAVVPAGGRIPGGDEPGARHFGPGGRRGGAGLHRLVRVLGAGRFVSSDGLAGAGGAGAFVPDHVRQRPGLRRLLGLDALTLRARAGGGGLLRRLARPPAGAGRGLGGEGGARVRGPLARAPR